MSENILTANPGAGGAKFKVDLDNGTSTPYMLLAGTTQIFGAIGVTSGAFTGQVSSFPISTTMVNIVSSVPLGFTPVGASQVFGQVSSFPIGTTFANVMSSVPHALVGTSMVNIVSSVPLGFTPTGTSMVNIVSSVSLGFTPVGTSQIFGQVSTFPIGTTSTQIVSSNLLAPLNNISSNIFVDKSAWVTSASRLGVIGGVYSSTFTAVGHQQAAAIAVNVSSQAIMAPGSAEGSVSTRAVVFTAVVDGNGNQVTGFGSGTQYVDNAATTAPTGMVSMFKFGAANSTMVAVASSTPLPVYQISTGPVGPLQGTTMVNIVSTITQGIVGQVSTFANNVASTFVVGTVVQSTTPIPATQGGLDIVWYPSVTSAPRTIKNSAGRLYDIWFTNSGTSTRWLSLFNQSSAAASTGTTVPLMRFGLPATGTTNAVSGWLGSAFGYQFSTAISCSVTASSGTSTDTSAPPTNDVMLTFGYR